MKPLQDYAASLVDRTLMPTAVRVALVIGTLLLVINHGSAIAQNQMTRQRWVSAFLTYIVPYCVNIHGQYISRTRQSKS